MKKKQIRPKLRALLDSDDEDLAYQMRHVLGLTADSKTIAAVLGYDPTRRPPSPEPGGIVGPLAEQKG